MKLREYKGLKIKKNQIKVDNNEIDKSLDYLRESRAKIITVNRPAQKDDRIEIDFEVRSDGVKIENGESKNHPLILGQGRFLNGFEDNLEGMSAREEKSFSLKVPSDWPDKRIIGKNLDFKVKMKLVQKRELSDINDEFAKSLGKFESLEELKNNIKDGITQEKEIKEKQRIRIELIEKTADGSEVEISTELIEQEKENMLNELKANIAGLGLGFERYLEQIKKTIEEIKKEWQEQAKKRAKIGLCLNAIAEKENIQISDEETELRINEDLKHYENIKDTKKDIDPIKLREYYKNILKNEKVFELLEREAKII